MEKSRGIDLSEKDFDDWVKYIQEEIIEKERQTYSEKVIEEYQAPKNFYKLENANRHSKNKGTCGDTMEIFLKIDNNKIINASFLTDGCGATIACGSFITQMIKGKKVKDVLKITSQDLIEALDTLKEIVELSETYSGNRKQAIEMLIRLAEQVISRIKRLLIN